MRLRDVFLFLVLALLILLKSCKKIPPASFVTFVSSKLSLGTGTISFVNSSSISFFSVLNTFFLPVFFTFLLDNFLVDVPNSLERFLPLLLEETEVDCLGLALL